MAQQETGRWQKHPPQSLHLQPASPWLWVSVIAASLPLTCCGLSVRTIFPNPAKPHLDDGNSGRRGGKISPRKACRPHPLATGRTQPTPPTPTPTLSTHIICHRWAWGGGPASPNISAHIRECCRPSTAPQEVSVSRGGWDPKAPGPLLSMQHTAQGPEVGTATFVPATPKTQEASAQPVRPERGMGAAEEDGYWQPPG